MHGLGNALIGDWHRPLYAAVKAVALFLTAAVALRLVGHRTPAGFGPFDWLAAGAVGAIVGRTATAFDASWLSGSAALLAVLAVHAVVVRLRYFKPVRRVVDPPPVILIRHGRVDHQALRRSGMTEDDLAALLRQQNHTSPEAISLAVLEPRGEVSILAGADDPSARPA